MPEELATINVMNARPDKTWLTERQSLAVEKIIFGVNRCNAAVVWWKVGEGKTRIGLRVWLKLCAGDEGELLVICSPKAIRQWQEEIDECPWANWLARTRYLSYGALSQTPDKAAQAIDTLFTAYPINMVIVDELWLYKNPKTIRARALQRIRNIGVPMIGLSGSMMTARNIEDIYGQASSIGLGHLVARSLTHFRSQFCNTVKEYFGLTYWPKKTAVETIQKRLAPAVDIYFPPKVIETRIRHVTVEPSPAQRRAINDLIAEYYTEFGSDSVVTQKGELTRVKVQPLEIKHATTLLIKLQQISDGVVTLEKGKELYLESNKMHRLREMVEEYNDAGQTPIIWCGFVKTVEALRKVFGSKAAFLSSKHEFDSAGFKVGAYKCVVATVGSGISLNDFKNCQYSIFYSTTFNALSLHQAMGRTARKGSRHTVANYQFLSTATTPDREIYTGLLASNNIEATAVRTSAAVLAQWAERQKF